MEKHLEAFISNNIPDFISSDYPTFKAFIEAYYEFLEAQNTDSSASVKQLFNNAPNPGAIVNDASLNRDIDETYDAFVDYFRREVLPIAVESEVGDKFLIKKIRDLYLSKGTPKAYKLLFRLLYNEEVDIFQTKDSILEASEGNYLSFPIARFQVTDFESALSDINFTLASLVDDSENEVATVLSANKGGTINGNDVLYIQLNRDDVTFDSNIAYRIIDPEDRRIFIEVKPVLTLTKLTITGGGAGYTIGDRINVRSKSTGRTFASSVGDIKSGGVTGLFVRERGQNYSVGDVISFTVDNPLDGSGGSATITAVDEAGRITEIDGTPLRTGRFNNGLLSSQFNDVIVPINNGGSYRTIPNIHINSQQIQVAKPYQEDTGGVNAQITALSDNIGEVTDITIVDTGFFANDSDVEIISPFNITFENVHAFSVGETVAFQKFVPIPEAFDFDSEKIIITVTITRDDDSDYPERVVLPVRFDNSRWLWSDSEFFPDSETGFRNINWSITVVDGNDSETFYVTYDSDSDYAAITDSDSMMRIVLDRNELIDSLDRYHFNRLDRFKVDNDQFDFDWKRIEQEPAEGYSGDAGNWVNTGFFGVVTGAGNAGQSVTITELPGKAYPTDSDLDSEGRPANTLLRLASVDPLTEEVDTVEEIELANIIVSYDVAQFDYELGTLAATSKTFIDESGFLNSLSGGIVQDGYFYSNFSYTIQTRRSIEDWRQIVKTLLHPAGMNLIGELNVNNIASLDDSFTTDTIVDNNTLTSFTFDASQEHYEDPENYDFISADTTRRRANAFEIYNIFNSNGVGLTADNYERGLDNVRSSQYGNSFWDYEPIGFIGTHDLSTDVDVSNYSSRVHYDQIQDSWENKLTTQDSDGNGKVLNETIVYTRWNETINDLYKGLRYNDTLPPTIIDTRWIDPINQAYHIYNNDSDFGFYVKWDDSEVVGENRRFEGLDYSDIVDTVKAYHGFSTDDSEQLQGFIIRRKHEILVQEQADFNTAMKEQQLLVFEDPELGTLYDFEAYERKWNYVNSLFTRDDFEGWTIPGSVSTIQNLYTLYPRYKWFPEHTGTEGTRGVNTSVFYAPQFNKNKTPLTPQAWGVGTDDLENVIWRQHYNFEINNGEKIIYDYTAETTATAAADYLDPRSNNYDSIGRNRRGS